MSVQLRVIYLQYTNPAGYPPLQHSSHILADNGWEVLFLGSGAKGAEGLAFPAHPHIRVRRMGFCREGLLQKLHYAGFVLWVLLWTLSWRPRWVYASDLLSCPVAALLAFVPGLRLLYHEHDSPGMNGEAPISKFQKLLLSARRRVAQKANLCVLPNTKRAERFRQETVTQRPVLCVWNCPSLEEASANKNDRSEIGDKFVLFFHGSIVPARLPMTIIEALARLPDRVVLHIAGYETIGHTGYTEDLKRCAEKLGIGARFKVIGVVPSRHSLLEYCRAADVGLALMPLQSTDLNEQAMAGASNKPFDYLACGLALLVSDSEDWRMMFVDPGYGRACDPMDTESVVRSLQWFVDHPAETLAMGMSGRERIVAQWNYEQQFSPVLAHMTKEQERR